MTTIRPFKHVKHKDLWLRCSHRDTMLVNEMLQLAWPQEPSVTGSDLPAPPNPGGLAFDPWCRLYHAMPEDGTVERVRWAKKTAVTDQSEPVLLFLDDGKSSYGDFTAQAKKTPLKSPSAVTVDSFGNLFIAESGAKRVLVYDLLEPRLLRKIGVSPHRPLDCDHLGERVYLLLDDPVRVMIMEARLGPWDIDLSAESGEAELENPPESKEEILAAHGTPSRIAVGQNGVVYILFNGGKKNAAVVPLRPTTSHQPFCFQVDSGRIFTCKFATDLAFMSDVESTSSAPSQLLVVGRRPGEDFLVFSVDGKGRRDTKPPLTARNYDGRGIVCTPDNRILFWTSRGYRHAVAGRVTYKKRGQCTTFAMDSGSFGTVWGRIFINACIPDGADIRLHYYASDDLPEPGKSLPRTLPCCYTPGALDHEALSPPMPPLSRIPVPGKGNVQFSLYRRTTGNEIPWTREAPGDPFATYEAQVIAEAGRYLWVTLELTGTGRSTPRVKSIRVEYPSHDLLNRLPKIYSRDKAAADFLRRYLAMFEGETADLSVRAFNRHALISSQCAPEEILPWLADFVGLVLDHRWPEPVKRQAIKEAIWLFRFRGTIKGLSRFLWIYLGREPIIIEHYRVRGMGGAMVGPDASPASKPVIGAGFRVGGAVGDTADSLKDCDDGFDTHAHRFSVVLPVEVSDEQLEVIHEILQRHRPAHTLYDVCTVDSGMRLGIGLYVGLTSIAGSSSGFGKIQIGASLLGRGDLLWQHRMRISPTGSRLGKDSRAG